MEGTKMIPIAKRQEFEEIAHCGGNVRLLFDAQRNGVSLRWSGSGPYAASLFQLLAAIEGSSAIYVPVGASIRVRNPTPCQKCPSFILAPPTTPSWETRPGRVLRIALPFNIAEARHSPQSPGPYRRRAAVLPI
jgi:hypothetical protein